MTKNRGRSLATQRTNAQPGLALLMVVTSLGVILAPLNSTMIAVALPEIRQHFSLSHAEVGWLVSSYLIAMAVVQPIGGRLGDQVGRRLVFRVGLVAFLAASVAAVFAPTFSLLITLRIAQAVVGAALVPNAMAMLREGVPDNRLGRVNGINAAVISSAAAVGPVIGAAALRFGSWRLLFLVSVPVVLAGLLLESRLPHSPTPNRPRVRIDALGAGLFVALLASLTLQLGTLHEGGGGGATAAGWVVLAALAAAFAWRQARTPSPAADWALFRIRSFAAASGHVLFTNLVMYTTLLMIPFFVKEIQGKGSATTGVLLGVLSTLMAVTAPFGGRLADAHGRRLPAQLGAGLVLIASTALLVGLSPERSVFFLAGFLALLGVGVGLGTGPAVTAAIESAPRRAAGSAAGTSSMMRYFGSILGAGILGGVLADAGTGAPDIAVFRLLLAVIVTMAALSAVAASLIHVHPGWRAEAAPIPVASPAE